MYFIEAHFSSVTNELQYTFDPNFKFVILQKSIALWTYFMVTCLIILYFLS